MTLPTNLQTAIDKELSGMSQNRLAEAVDGLSKRYREPSAQRQYMAANIDRSAYIACRMPATFAVICRVLSEIQSLQPEIDPKSLIDLGSGPGTALWAAAETFPNLERLAALEGDAELMQLGKRLGSSSEDNRLENVEWKHQDLNQLTVCPSADIVIASYALGELSEEAQLKLLAQAWQSAGKALVLIEPGTPVGFKRVLDWRCWLLSAQATILAPCPHEKACPMSGTDWCHFSQRLSRSSLHRQLKGAALGPEDEKFSYIVAVKQQTQSPVQPSLGRILRHPQKHSGHLEMTLCSLEGNLDKKVISRRDGDLYKKSRKLEWGDLI
jgi:ribosomal protein RSM22 (predicted rRNA methylase)